MKAVVTISCYHFAFTSAAQAAKVVEALSKAVQVEQDYQGGKEVYSPASKDQRPARVTLQLVPDDSFVLQPRVPESRRLYDRSKDGEFLAGLTGGSFG